MIDLELLEKLVAFQKYGTLSATADHLMVTQPTITRSMKKLEEQLGASLFDRSVSNRIKLNETGILAAAEAQKLLRAQEDFTSKIRNFAHRQDEWLVGSVAPGPELYLETLRSQLPHNFEIQSQLIAEADVSTELLNFKKHLIFTTSEINTSEIESMYLGTEHLSVALDNFNPLAQHSAVTFAELSGLSFLVESHIGPWRQIIEKYITNATFLYQENPSSINELSRYSNFPFFFSNLSQTSPQTTARFASHSRTKVAINDPHNVLELFGTYRKDDRTLLQPLLKAIIKNWP